MNGFKKILVLADKTHPLLMFKHYGVRETLLLTAWIKWTATSRTQLFLAFEVPVM